MKNKLEISLPKSWADLNEKQLLIVSEILCIPDKTKEEIILMAFKFLSGIEIISRPGRGIFLCRIKKKRFTIESWQISYHSKNLEWITQMPVGLRPIPSICGHKALYHTLEGTPLKMYLAAENYYQAFIHTQDPKYLVCLATVLYSGKRIKTWDDSKTKNYVMKFRNCGQYHLFSVFLWYQSIKALLSARFEYLFTPSDTDSTEVPDMRRHINSMIRSLTAGDVTKMAAVLETETWYALGELDEKAREIEEFNEKNK